MTYALKTFFKLSIYSAFIMPAVKVNAQVSLIQNAIDKLESYKNFSYQTIRKQVVFTSDTTIMQQKSIFLKTPEDKNFGYWFSIKTQVKADKLDFTEIYNRQQLNFINSRDSTYQIKQIHADYLFPSLLERLKRMKDQLERKPGIVGADTLINGISSSYLIVDASDYLFIDKLSGLPTAIIEKGNDGHSSFYMENRYFDYKFNQDNIDVAIMTIPEWVHPPKDQPALVRLTPGTVAPDWTLHTTDGKKVSLSQMNGKVVLLDFYFIGCIPCMQALKPLNKLYEKYKNQNFIMASITERNNEKTVLTFDKQYDIKYPSLVKAADVVKLYHVSEFPTFYFIDKEGKIAKVILGYTDDFETTATSMIDSLLSK